MRRIQRLSQLYHSYIRMEDKPKTIIVTGSNKGIGYGIVEGLAKEGSKWHIYMACRNPQLANKSRSQLASKYPSATIQTLELDVSNNQSIDKFVQNLSDKKIGVDVLVNNAGIAWKGDAFDNEVVKGTFGTNFFGTVHLSEAIVPVMNQNGKIIIVGSMAGKFKILKSEELLKKWKKQDLTREQLFDNVNDFIQAVKDNNYADKGYPKSAYGMSKLAINLYAGVLSKSKPILDKHIQVYTLCPGYVSTDMSSHKGVLTIEQGAETPLFLIHLPFEIDPKYQGKFFEKSALSSLN